MFSTKKKTERITARVSMDIREKLIEAAAFSGATLNQFLVQAALEKAQEVLEKERVINLSYKDAEVFFSALENPPMPNKKLKNAVKNYKSSGLYEPI
ncbi:MAG: DUF1778 domain-containing protein [Deltaproteobacteria bacterium]|nr:DUF1778 domain-containing protein [Deltaproteobacteria bacterium]